MTIVRHERGSRPSGGNLARLTALAILLGATRPHLAVAQPMGAAMPQIPTALDLKKVPVGSWAEYNLVVPGTPPMTQRYALVKRVGNLQTLEIWIAGGTFASGQDLLLKVDVDLPAASSAPRARSAAIQFGMGGEPMSLPPGAEGQAQFETLDPKKLVGTERVVVPAGTFETKRYRGQAGSGGTYSYWMSEEVKPLGLVRLDATTPGGKPVVLKLVAHGGDARARVIKPVGPFDASKAMLGMQGLTVPTGTPPAAPSPR
jgi:hypothetical protein